MTPKQKQLILEALDRLGDEDNMNRCILALSKGVAAYPRSVLADYQETVNHLAQRIALAESIREELNCQECKDSFKEWKQSRIKK